MNKTELIEAIAGQTGLKKKDAEAAVVAFVNAVETALSKGEKVQLVGFGTFETKTRGAREGRNPKTGETIPLQLVTAALSGIGLIALLSKKSKKEENAEV